MPCGRLVLVSLLCVLHHGAPFGSPNPQLLRHRRSPQFRAVVHHHRTRHCHNALVSSNDSWGNWAVLLASAASAQVVGQSTAVGRLLGPPVTAMAMSFVLASVGILTPGGTAASKSLQILALQLATPLILLGADLRDAGRRCGPLIVSFAAASLATIVGCIVGWNVAGRSLTRALGRDGLVIAAALLAKNIGGGINYIAVCNTLNASATAIAAGLCMDNIFALLYFPATSALASNRPDVQTLVNELGEAPVPITVQSISNTLCLGVLLLWIGERMGGTSVALPMCTLVTVLLQSLAPYHWLTPLRSTAECLGTVALYVFFSTAGSPGVALADSVRVSIVPLSVFLLCLYVIHGGILTVSHKLFRRSASFVPQRLLVASSAAIGGPATAVALAQGAGWKSLLVPSVIVGNIGYAIATFCGLGYFSYFAK